MSNNLQKWFDNKERDMLRKSRWKTALIVLVPVGVLILIGLYLTPYFKNPWPLFRHPSSTMTSFSDPDHWQTSGGDPAHTRHSPGKTTISGSVRWSLALAETLPSSPVIADGIVYVGDVGRVIALKGEDGSVIWVYPTTGPVETTPALADGLIFFGLLDGRIIALDRFNGQVQWQYQTGNFIDNSPVVEKGVLYIGSADGNLYALDAVNGKVIWKTPIGSSVRYSPSVRHETLYAANNNNQLYGLNTGTGAQQLLFLVSSLLKDAPVITGDLVHFVPADGKLYTFSHHARTYPGSLFIKRLWAQLWVMGIPVPRPTAQAGSMGRIVSPHQPGRFVSSPAVTPERLFIGDHLGWCYALDATRRTVLWEFKAESAITTAPITVGDQVYFGSQGGFLYSLQQADGHLLHKIYLGAPLTANLAYSGGTMFARTMDGRLHAID